MKRLVISTFVTALLVVLALPAAAQTPPPKRAHVQADLANLLNQEVELKDQGKKIDARDRDETEKNAALAKDIAAYDAEQARLTEEDRRYVGTVTSHNAACGGTLRGHGARRTVQQSQARARCLAVDDHRPRCRSGQAPWRARCALQGAAEGDGRDGPEKARKQGLARQGREEPSPPSERLSDCSTTPLSATCASASRSAETAPTCRQSSRSKLAPLGRSVSEDAPTRHAAWRAAHARCVCA